MHQNRVSRRTIFGALPTLAVIQAARAQGFEDTQEWGQAMAAIWSEILEVPFVVLRDSAFAAYSVADSEIELAEAQSRAATKRAEMEAGIVRCRALVDAAPPAPHAAEPWEQTIIDQVRGDQGHALERLAQLAAFLEANSNNYAGGTASFPAAMRMANWALFGETDWIMAASSKLERLGKAPNGFMDLWCRATTLDWLASSIIRDVCVHIVHGGPPTKITEAQTALASVAFEMRQLSALFRTADQRPLGVVGEARLRVLRLLPRLGVLAEDQARTLEEISRAWPSLSPAELIAEDATFDQAPSFVRTVAPLVGAIGQPT